MAGTVDKELIRSIAEEVVRATQHHQCPLFSDDDVVFFRRVKAAIDRIASGIGMAIILGFLGALGFLIKMGIESWRIGGRP